MKRASIRAASLALLVLMVTRCAFAQPTSLADRLIATYSGLEIYCDRARHHEDTIRGLPASCMW